jgi:hypothetical protein
MAAAKNQAGAPAFQIDQALAPHPSREWAAGTQTDGVGAQR